MTAEKKGEDDNNNDVLITPLQPRPSITLRA